MTNVQPLDRSIKDFPAPASTPSRLGTSNLLPTRSAAQTFLSGIPDKSHCAAASTASPRCRCKWTGPKPCDTPQNLPEQLAWDRHFGHLERHVLRVLCHLGTDLHQLLPQCCKRPVLHATGQRQTAQEIGQVVGQGEQLQANLVVGKAAAGKPGREKGDILLYEQTSRMSPFLCDRPEVRTSLKTRCVQHFSRIT